MTDVSAEKQASEVLHSLLAVEKIEKQEIIIDNNEPAANTFVTNQVNDQGETTIQYTPVSISHSLFSAIEGTQFTQGMEDQQVVIWEGHAIVDPLEPNINAIYTATPIDPESEALVKKQSEEDKSCNTKPSNNGSTSTGKKKEPIKKKKKPGKNVVPSNDPTKLEQTVQQVKERFKRGCECQDESCFRGLNPETVFKHRHNIAELTKGEHDMYLMGVTMACLANPDTTVRHRERRRLRAQYVYQGRRVCLDAFLYLENCTHYQLKRIRKHVMTHGVTPRVHGNHGKKPHNTFSLDIYCHAREFLKQYLEQHTGEKDILNTKQSVQLPWDITRKNLHEAYKEYGQILEPGVKLMGYSTFRYFMKEQFPHVKFCKTEPKGNVLQSTQNQSQVQTIQIERPRETQTHTQQQVQKCVITNDVQQVIPLVVQQPVTDNGGNHHQQTFLVTPLSQVLPNGNVVAQQNNANHNANTFSYQLANTGYVINEQGNIVTSNGQHSYFGRMQ